MTVFIISAHSSGNIESPAMLGKSDFMPLPRYFDIGLARRPATVFAPVPYGGSVMTQSTLSLSMLRKTSKESPK